MALEQTTRKDELLDDIVAYVFSNGVSDLSLRPLAEALRTNPRMLLYHFASKDQLVVEVLASARARQYEFLADWRAAGATLPELVARYWEWAAAETSRAYLRLFFEVFGLAVQHRAGTEEVLPALTAQATAFFQPATECFGIPAAEAERLSRLAIATVRGLLLDLVATNDRPPLDEALKSFLRFLTIEIESRR